jgi:hypothetical protein
MEALQRKPSMPVAQREQGACAPGPFRYRFFSGRRTCVVATLTILLGPCILEGQSPTPEDSGLRGRLTIVASPGWAFGGPGKDLMDQMRRAGFSGRQPRECLDLDLIYIDLGNNCTEGGTYPESVGSGLTFGITARFALRPTFAAAAGYSTNAIGGANGYNPATRTHLYSAPWDATYYWIGGFWTPSRSVRLGGGPAHVRIHNWVQGGTSRLGMIGEVGLDAPMVGPLFLDLAVRAHLVPSVEIAHGLASSGPDMDPSLRVSATHLAATVGIGFRPF